MLSANLSQTVIIFQTKRVWTYTVNYEDTKLSIPRTELCPQPQNKIPKQLKTHQKL